MWDVTTPAALRALDGLAQRGTVRANNIANAETPGFRAQTVDFESRCATPCAAVTRRRRGDHRRDRRAWSTRAATRSTSRPN